MVNVLGVDNVLLDVGDLEVARGSTAGGWGWGSSSTSRRPAWSGSGWATRSRGCWVMAHAQGADGIKAAVRAGIRSIEHGIYLDDEAIEMMLERGTWLVPTLVAPRGVLAAAAAGVSLPDAVVRKAAEVSEAHADSFRRAVAAGVKVAMGTDSGVTPHGRNLAELELMAEGGMAPAAVLHATTASAAAGRRSASCPRRRRCAAPRSRRAMPARPSGGRVAADR